MPVVAIHQPEFLPWLGFCDKALQADVFVLLDTVQFRKNYFQNRNRIRTADGWIWITVPVKHPQLVPIADVRVDARSSSYRKNPKRIEQEYRGAPYFDRYFPDLAARLGGGHDRLETLNLDLIRYTFDALAITTPLVLASDIAPAAEGGATAVVLDLCRRLGASAYLSGVSGREYLDLTQFADAGIPVRFQEFHHPVYTQLHQPFVPCLSAVDLIFNHGPASREILSGVGGQRLETVFQ
jgi:hypothetical protein